MKLQKSPCETQECKRCTTNPGCYRDCNTWQTWFRESWRSIQKRFGIKSKEEQR